MLEARTRPFTPAEKRLLRARIHDLEARMKRAPKVLIPGVVIIFVLCVSTFLASDAPGLVVTGFWAVVGAAVLIWVLRGTRKDVRYFSSMAHAYRSALERNEAEVYDVRSSAFVEFEEVEDEGACYAFQIDRDRIVFVSGQQFYPEAKFPSHDFSLVHVLDENGAVIDEHIEKRGLQAAAEQILPTSMKLGLDIPDHLEVRNGRIEDLEELLEPYDSAEPA